MPRYRPCCIGNTRPTLMSKLHQIFYNFTKTSIGTGLLKIIFELDARRCRHFTAARNNNFSTTSSVKVSVKSSTNHQPSENNNQYIGPAPLLMGINRLQSSPNRSHLLLRPMQKCYAHALLSKRKHCSTDQCQHALIV